MFILFILFIERYTYVYPVVIYLSIFGHGIRGLHVGFPALEWNLDREQEPRQERWSSAVSCFFWLKTMNTINMITHM